jgi:hypothetical protein
MPYQTSLPAALKLFGLKVQLVDGWKTRGSSSFNPHGAVGHHTAGPKAGDHPSLHICTVGRPDLNGPLCNTFLPRGLTKDEQVIYVVAAGRANHAGLGGFRGLAGNSSVFGTEAESTGVGNDWTDWQKWAYPRVMAAQLKLAGKDETWYCSHRTWAPTRKIDPTNIADTWMKTQVKQVFFDLKHPAKPTPPKTETPVAVAVGKDEITLGPFASKTLVGADGKPVTEQITGNLWQWSAAHAQEAHRLSLENNLMLRALLAKEGISLPSGVDKA